jgi:hypothetical protein
MAEEAKAIVVSEIAQLEAIVRPDMMLAPLEELNGAELMARGALSGLRQLNRIIEQRIDVEDRTLESLKQQRLVGDMSHALLKQAREKAAGDRNTDLIGRLLQMLDAEKGDSGK